MRPTPSLNMATPHVWAAPAVAYLRLDPFGLAS